MTRFPKLSRKKTLVFATACMMAVPSMGQDEELDLGELFDLNMEVTVASKKAEKISDAPGMIVAYSDKDIKNTGYYTIKELADLTTGFSTYTAYGEKVLESRGQKAGSFNNNKHLLLIDGIPVHNARNYKAPIEEVTLLGAQRVEFLKGPGSALYGTGAFYGVVNVIPKELTENGSWTKAMITLSTEDLSKRAMATSVTKRDAGTFYVTASYFDKEASQTNTMLVSTAQTKKYDGYEGGDTTNNNYQNYDDQNSQFINFSYKLDKSAFAGLGFGMIYTRKSGGLGENWGGESYLLNHLLWETAIPYIKYQREFTDRFSFNSYLKGNYSNEQGMGKGFEYYTQIGDFETLLEANWDFGDAGALIAGVNYDVRKELAKGNVDGSHEINWKGADGGLDDDGNQIFDVEHDIRYFTPSPIFHTISAYAQYQVEFPVLSGLKLTAGVRNDNGVSVEGKDATNPNTGEKLDRESNSFTRVSPRVGLVQKFSDRVNAKVLYGTALRSPGMKEYGLLEESRITIQELGSDKTLDDVGAEVINTIEGSTNLTLSKFNASIAGYFNVTNDALDGYSITVQDSIGHDTLLNVFGNSEDQIKGGGVEVDIQAMPIKQLKIMAGGSYGKSYAFSTDENGKEIKNQVYGVPTGKINAAVTYTHAGAFRFSLTPTFKYIMGYRLGGDGDMSDSDIKDDNRITSGVPILDINAVLPVNEHLGFEVMGRNLTNTEFYQPFAGGLQNDKGEANANPKIPGPSVAFSLVGQF